MVKSRVPMNSCREGPAHRASAGPRAQGQPSTVPSPIPELQSGPCGFLRELGMACSEAVPVAGGLSTHTPHTRGLAGRQVGARPPKTVRGHTVTKNMLWMAASSGCSKSEQQTGRGTSTLRARGTSRACACTTFGAACLSLLCGPGKLCATSEPHVQPTPQTYLFPWPVRGLSCRTGAGCPLVVPKHRAGPAGTGRGQSAPPATNPAPYLVQVIGTGVHALAQNVPLLPPEQTPQ